MRKNRLEKRDFDWEENRDYNYYQDKRIKENFKIAIFLIGFAFVAYLIAVLLMYLQTGILTFEMK